MRKILVVEDDEFIRDLLTRKLQLENFFVKVVHTGEGALDELRSTQHDLLILDLELPGVSGVEVLETLWKEPLSHQMPIIIFSNKDDQETREKCKAFGATNFFVKANTDLDELIEKVNELVS